MSELYKAFAKLKQAGMEDLILTSKNGGSMLRTAIQMADEFVEQNHRLHRRPLVPADDTFARILGRFEQGRLVVLIDQGSASASERPVPYKTGIAD